MTPLHTFNEYHCAKAVLCQLEEKLLLVGLSDKDTKERNELWLRIKKFEKEIRNTKQQNHDTDTNS